jgi:hypothetical protein
MRSKAVYVRTVRIRQYQTQEVYAGCRPYESALNTKDRTMRSKAVYAQGRQDMSKRKTIVGKLEKEASAVDDLISELLSRNVDEAPFFREGKDYIIDGVVYRLAEITEDDPVVLVFLSDTGKRVDVTPYSEVKIYEQS